MQSTVEEGVGRRKLVIYSGNGAVDDRKPSGLNGEASKVSGNGTFGEQGAIRNSRPVMTADETRNLQNVDYEDWGVTPTPLSWKETTVGNITITGELGHSTDAMCY